MIDRRLYILLTTGETNMYFFYIYTHTIPVDELVHILWMHADADNGDPGRSK